MFQEI